MVVLEELPQPLLLLLPLPSFVLLELEAPILHFLLPLPIAVCFLGSAVSASAAAVFFEAGGTAAAASSSAAAAAGFFLLELEEELLPLLHLLLPLASSFFALEPAEPTGPPALVWPFELTTVVEAAAIIEGAAAGPALGAAVLAPVLKLLAVLAIVSSHCHYDTTHNLAAPLRLRLRRRTDAAPPAAAAVD